MAANAWRFIILPSCFLFLSTSTVFASPRIDYPHVDSNTPFSEVAKLSANQPDKTIVYGSESEDQYALFWRAKGNAKGLVVFVHGGCWLDAFDIKHANPLSTALSQEGYHVWSIEYRRTGSGGEWPNAFEDIRLGLKSITELSSMGVGLSIVNLVGHSAGGHLALLASADKENILSKTSRLNTIGLAAIVDINAYSMGENSCQKATPKFMQGSSQQRPMSYFLANPLNFNFEASVDNKALLMHGKLDAIVPSQQSTHPDISKVSLSEAGHFDWIHPGSDAFKLLLANLQGYKY